MEFFTVYNPPKVAGVKFIKASLTRQEFANDADLNKIMERYSAGLAPLPSGVRFPQFGDFSDGLDFQACLDKLIAAQTAFDSLPSAVRDRFSNDPARLLDFLSDEKNRDEAIKLGLVEPVKEVVPANNESVPDKGATE